MDLHRPPPLPLFPPPLPMDLPKLVTDVADAVAAKFDTRAAEVMAVMEAKAVASTELEVKQLLLGSRILNETAALRGENDFLRRGLSFCVDQMRAIALGQKAACMLNKQVDGERWIEEVEKATKNVKELDLFEEEWENDVEAPACGTMLELADDADRFQEELKIPALSGMCGTIGFLRALNVYEPESDEDNVQEGGEEGNSSRVVGAASADSGTAHGDASPGAGAPSPGGSKTAAAVSTAGLPLRLRSASRMRLIGGKRQLQMRDGVLVSPGPRKKVAQPRPTRRQGRGGRGGKSVRVFGLMVTPGKAPGGSQ